MPPKTPSVVLVGRPNVGKSTLFNRITGSRRAIVAPIAGTARDSLLEFYQLGFEPVIEISAEHGTGVAELLDEVVKQIGGSRLEDGASGPASEELDPQASVSDRQPPAPDETAVAIVGRPNVGKSSLVNRLLHEERVLVSEMPGTTRDAIDTVLLWHRHRFRIVDTAGMRG